VFPEISFNYNANEWQNQAIEQIRHSGENQKEYDVLKDEKWFYFNKEALEQREYVMERIKIDLE